MIDHRMQSILEGARDTLPLVIAAMPFGIVYGALAHAQGLPDWVIAGISLLVFAGSAQFIAITLVAAGATLPVIVMTVFLVNLRHLLYAITLVPRVRRYHHWLRLPMAFTLTDETFAVVFNRIAQDRTAAHFAHYYLGSAALMYGNWQLCTWVGLIAGDRFPALTHFGLDIAMVVAFIGIVVPLLKLPSHWICALIAAFSGVLTYHWPHQSGLLFSALIAIGGGVISENWLSRPSTRSAQ